MLVEGKPDIVVAFEGHRGTADMVERARKAGIEVREIRRRMMAVDAGESMSGMDGKQFRARRARDFGARARRGRSESRRPR